MVEYWTLPWERMKRGAVVEDSREVVRGRFATLTSRMAV